MGNEAQQCTYETRKLASRLFHDRPVRRVGELASRAALAERYQLSALNLTVENFAGNTEFIIYGEAEYNVFRMALCGAEDQA